MIKCLLLTCGYVESAHVSRLGFIYQGDKEFETLEDAMSDLAHSLFEKYKFENFVYRPKKACCQDAAQIKDAEFCPMCGTSLGEDIDFEVFEQWLTELHGKTCDEYGGEEAGAWWPWITLEECLENLNELAEIRENAERYLIAALDHKHLSLSEYKALQDYRKGLRLFDSSDLRNGTSNQIVNFGRDLELPTRNK